MSSAYGRVLYGYSCNATRLPVVKPEVSTTNGIPLNDAGNSWDSHERVGNAIHYLGGTNPLDFGENRSIAEIRLSRGKVSCVDC